MSQPESGHAAELGGQLPFEAHRLFHDLPFIGMAVTSPASRRWVQVNRSLCDILGYPREELVQKTWEELTHPDDLASDVAEFERVMSGERDGYKMDKRFIRGDGRVIHATIDVKAIRAANGVVDLFVATVADITLRVEAERAAREAALLLRNLGHQVPGVLYQFQMYPDGRSRFPFASEAIAEIYEVTPEVVRDDAAAVFARLHPDDLARVEASIAESARTLETWQCDYRVILPQRGLRWLTGQARPERLDDGSTLWHGFITDSTAQQLAREALRESEERFRIQVEHAPEAIIVYDPETNRFLDANRNAEELFGWSRAEMLLRGIAEISPPMQPDGRPSMEAGFAQVTRAMRGETPVFEWMLLHSSGREVQCEIRLVALPYHGRLLVRGSVSDISKRKQELDALTKLESAIESSLNGVAMADLTGRLTYVNRAILEMWGYRDSSEVLGREVLAFWHSREELSLVVSALQSEGTWSGEMTTIHRDGARREMRVNASLFRDSAGVPAGMLASFADVTEEKRLQSQLLQAQKMESVGRLAGGIAHDFNNLLTVMKGYLELSISSLKPDSAVRQDLLEIDHAADSAAALTQQLLAYSRKQIISPVALNLNDVVRRVRGMLQRILGEDITLQIATDEALAQVRFDPGQAEQILVNLAANARDAMPEGGQLTVQTSNVTIDDAYAATHPDCSVGDYVLLAVSDTGLGMSAETREHAFEPFFTTKEVGRGTGLGLAMIHGAVMQNGGRVDVYSEPGLGTSFKIYLPAVREARSAVTEPVADAPPRGTENILLVEDDPTVRTLAARLLRRLGYHVTDFSSGAEALQWLREAAEPVHLLLTDVIMPEMNGKQLAEHAVAMRPTLRVLFVSGYTANVSVHHGVLKPGVDFLAKPFSVSALAKSVRSVLDGVLS